MRHEICSVCEISKPTNEFQKSNASPLERSDVCIDCSREQTELAAKKLTKKSQQSTNQRIWKAAARKIYLRQGIDKAALRTAFRKIDHLKKAAV